MKLADAFGNAIGNSIVNHHVESAARQKYISETGQKLSANAQAKVNQQAAKNLNQTLARINMTPIFICWFFIFIHCLSFIYKVKR
ncbi:hypothetical protein [Pseudoalteromonas holothuriae]|uniref:hypothetical protein n=1 Tax=Pseudoalteromonas holothuriae TaxID=2963714 RepID=UPI0021BF0E31|nr:hypothetical protein [Pseudoalteromonas sp. CIP111951]